MIHASSVLCNEHEIHIDPTSTVGPLCYLQGPLTIGPRSRLWPHVIAGTEPEHKRASPSGWVRIGADVTIRELVVIQRGTGDRDTSIGDRCYIMDHCHIAHDVTLAEDVTLSPNVTLGGHTRVHCGATIGIGAMTHQHTTIGAYAMVGMGAVVTRDVPPFCVVAGNPARFLRLNTKGIEAAHLTAEDVWIDGGSVVFSGKSVAYRRAFIDDKRHERETLGPIVANRIA